MPLEKLPATFNQSELHKGFFPYSWMKPEKYDYVGPYPPAKDYHPERMTFKRRKEFLTWHQRKVEAGAIFDFQKELSAYLKSDVYVLKGALTAFSEEMKELTGINPLTQCVNIASCASLVWRKIFLEENLIALLPQHGWRKNQVNQSQEALEWLEFENWKLGGEGRIQHVRNSLNGAVKVLTPSQEYSVDGYDAQTETGYEYQGCFYHRCIKCFLDKRQETRKCHPDRTIEEVFEATQKRVKMLRDVGYTVVEKWGCEFREQKKTDLQLQEFLKTYDSVLQLRKVETLFAQQ